MYESFYGLKVSPFQLNPNPAFYFDSRQHHRAKTYLEYGMRQKEGFIVVTGEIGAGKTTILRSLLNDLDPDKVVSAHLVSTQLEAEDTLRLVASSFGLPTQNSTKSDVLLALEAFLVSATRSGKRCLLIVDEAQNLTARSVEELRMLSNFQSGGEVLLQSFLVGQPEFRNILQSASMAQLQQRVIASCHIGPLDLDETQSYIEHRLKCAGSTGFPVFAPDCFPAIYKFSGGIPRRINTLCDRLLLGGYVEEKKSFDVRDVDDVIREIRGEMLGGESSPPVGAAAKTPATKSGAGAETAKVKKSSAAANAARSSESSNGSDVAYLEEHLIRLEAKMARLERIGRSTQQLLERLVDAMESNQNNNDHAQE